MAISPGTYNMTIQRRSDHSIQLVFKDSNNAAISLNGYTVEAQVWEETRTTKYADFAVTYTNRGLGTIDIALTDAQTATFSPDILKYDVLLTDTNGLKEYYLDGQLLYLEEIQLYSYSDQYHEWQGLSPHWCLLFEVELYPLAEIALM